MAESGSKVVKILKKLSSGKGAILSGLGWFLCLCLLIYQGIMYTSRRILDVMMMQADFVISLIVNIFSGLEDSNKSIVHKETCCLGWMSSV